MNGINRTSCFPPFQIFRQLNPRSFPLDWWPYRELNIEPDISFGAIYCPESRSLCRTFLIRVAEKMDQASYSALAYVHLELCDATYSPLIFLILAGSFESFLNSCHSGSDPL